MLPIIIGVVFILAGVCGILHWAPAVIEFLKGFVPLVLLIGGFLSLVSGLASFKVSSGDETESK